MNDLRSFSVDRVGLKVCESRYIWVRGRAMIALVVIISDTKLAALHGSWNEILTRVSSSCILHPSARCGRKYSHQN